MYKTTYKYPCGYEAIPAFTPCETLRDATYNISLPGVKFNNNEAMKNRYKFWKLNMVVLVDKVDLVSGQSFTPSPFYLFFSILNMADTQRRSKQRSLHNSTCVSNSLKLEKSMN